MLPVSPCCLFLHNVACFSGLTILDYPLQFSLTFIDTPHREGTTWDHWVWSLRKITSIHYCHNIYETDQIFEVIF
jgi:hypothetical protein